VNSIQLTPSFLETPSIGKMGRRDNLISKSILQAIFRDRKPSKRTILGRIFAFFTVFQLHLARYKDELFTRLRDKIWEMDEDEYRESFRGQDVKGKLKSVGDLGYSGSVWRPLQYRWKAWANYEDRPFSRLPTQNT
jgi:hypothetical protein